MAGAEEMADRAWTRLGTRAENQAVVFLGESGSGKTTVRSHLLSAILSKSASPLSTKLSLAAYVFDTLTTTKTATTATASKAGLFFELQYETSTSVNPTLIGGKVLNHRLERSRIASVPTGERSFHVLYYLLAGTSPVEKQHLGLDSGSGLKDGIQNRSAVNTSQKRWRYLGHPTQMKVGIDDNEGFRLFRTALRRLEFPRSEIAEICQILASILHIGQLEFETAIDTSPGGDDSGGYSHEGGDAFTAVKNKDVLAVIAAFLGVSARDLQGTLGYKTKILHRERVTVMLDPKGARENADELARTLYSLLVAYIIEAINQRVCAIEDTVGNTVSVVDFPGFQQVPATGSTLDQLFTNAATEALYNFTLQSFFERSTELLEQEEVNVAATSYFDNSDTVKGLLRHGNGILSILDDQSRRTRTDIQFLESLRKRFANKNNPAIVIGSATSKMPGSNFSTRNTSAGFTVKHFAGEVLYPAAGLVEENGEIVSGDLMNLISKTKSEFVRELFGQEALQKTVHPQATSAVMQAQVSSKPLRKPSVMRRNGERPSRFESQRVAGQRIRNDDSPTSDDVMSMAESQGKKNRDMQQGAAAQFLSALDNITKSLTASNTNIYFAICLKPNDRRLANQFDSKCVRTQMQTFGIPEISQRLRNADFGVFLPFGEFLGMAAGDASLVGSERDKVEMVLDEKRWPGNEAKIGSTGVFLSERCWSEIANLSERGFVVGRYATPFDDGGDGSLTPKETTTFDASKENLLSGGGGLTPGEYKKVPGYFGGREFDTRSEAGASALGQGDMFRNLDTQSQLAEKGNEPAMEEVDTVPTSASRKRWVAIVWILTWFVPDFAIALLGRMKRKDVRQAWREKLAINLMIWFACLFSIFVILIFPLLICPTQHVYDSSELADYDGSTGSDGSYVAIRGQVLDLAAFEPHHYPGSGIIPTKYLKKYAGTDATTLFPIQVSALCAGVNGSISPEVQLDYTNSTSVMYARYHNFNYYTNDSRPDWFFEQMVYLKSMYWKGHVGYSSTYMKTLAKEGYVLGSIDGNVYDFTDYTAGGRGLKAPVGQKVTATTADTAFMDTSVVDLFTARSGQDVSKYWHALDLDNDMRVRMQTCLNNLFYVGVVDTRDSVRCQFSTYFILAVSIAMIAVIGFKFLAALQFGQKNVPENLDKFVICQVPAYTEDEGSLRRAIDSLAAMKYDDKRKLLVVVCDGMIIGQGNDRPTPRIVLDILGVSDMIDPQPLSFESLGEGQKQHNMGKVYSGLYEVQGHIVPFLVIVKIGKPSEVSRPGNRGKRDSQMVMMRFLNRVAYNLPMTPLELEMFHQIKDVIGVNPQFYEYIFQVDADTVVDPDSAARMVSAFVDDTRLIGVCGETDLSNAKSSFTTMMQVYEYYISHNLIKAFESLFGSVTCLPGCFTMYRIRDAASNKPLFVSREIIEGYSTVRVDTLHMKNLLHLGEDRYLTTLLIKHHPTYKTKYIFGAHAHTIAPDTQGIFFSQRRRWINSTVHNLAELVPLQQLCGFCCFSMRFVVFIDLISTVVQPIIVPYIAYLIYKIASGTSTIPLTAFILLGAIYGLQAIIFIARRRWEMLGWMIVYIVALPLFSLFLPLYSFWHMDDFSWGNTRVEMAQGGKKIILSDEGVFDPASIPHQKWEDYKAEMDAEWEAQTQRDDRSEISGTSYATKSYHPGGHSEYGFPQSRALSLRNGSSYSLSPNYPYDPKSANIGYSSRLSFAPTEHLLGGQRNSMLGGGSQYSGNNDMELSNLGGGQPQPTDDELLAEIRNILASNQLIDVTKKSLRLELESRFGCSMDGRKAYINSATEALLNNQL